MRLRLFSMLLALCFFNLPLAANATSAESPISLPKSFSEITYRGGSADGAVELGLFVSLFENYERTIPSQTLTGIRILDNDRVFAGTVQQECVSCVRGKYYDSVTRSSSTIGEADSFRYSDGVISIANGPPVYLLSSEIKLTNFSPGAHVFSIEAVTTGAIVEPVEENSLKVSWNSAQNSHATLPPITGLISGKAMVGKALSVDSTGTSCVSWAIDGQIDFAKVGPTYTPSSNELGKSIQPVFWSNVSVEDQVKASPCNTTSDVWSPGKTVHTLGTKVYVARRAMLDWGTFESDGLVKNSTKKITFRVTDQGYGIPNGGFIRYKIGSGAFGSWRKFNFSNNAHTLSLKAAGNINIQVRMTDRIGTYTQSSYSQLKPAVSATWYWKSKTYVNGLWQGGTVHVDLRVSSWFSGKTQVSLVTNHAISWSGYDFGQYSNRSGLVTLKSGKIGVDIPVSFHGTYLVSASFIGTQRFSWGENIGVSY